MFKIIKLDFNVLTFPDLQLKYILFLVKIKQWVKSGVKATTNCANWT